MLILVKGYNKLLLLNQIYLVHFAENYVTYR